MGGRELIAQLKFNVLFCVVRQMMETNYLILVINEFTATFHNMGNIMPIFIGEVKMGTPATMFWKETAAPQFII